MPWNYCMCQWSHPLQHIKESMKHTDLYSRSQQDAKAKNNSFRKNQVRIDASRRLRKRERIPLIRLLWANVLRMMENMGYDLTKGPGLNFGKGRRALPRSFVPKGKTPNYYHRLAGGWAVCQLQSHQPLSLKGHYIIITRQIDHRGSQMSVSTTSLKNFQ